MSLEKRNKKRGLLFRLFLIKSIMEANSMYPDQTATLFVWFYSLRPSQHFSVMSGRVFLGLASTKQRIKCLAQVPPVGFESATPRS